MCISYKLCNYELQFSILTKHFYSDKIKEDEVGGACEAYGREGK
jgi:hypothetical protein